MFKIYLPHQKQLVSKRQKIFKFMFFKLLLKRQKFSTFIFSSTCFFQNLFSYFGRKFFRLVFGNLFLQQTSLVLFLYLHILCKNMSFQTRILFRYVYEWSKFFSEIISDLFLLIPQRQSQMSFLLYFSTIFSENILLNLAQNWVELNVRELFAIAFENNLLTDRYFVSGIEIVFHVLWFFY